VRVEYVGRAPLEGSDDRVLMATLRSGEPAPAPSNVRIASAAPFVSELRSSHSALRGDIPVPSERPYSLGQTSVDMASVNATELSARSARTSRVPNGSQVASANAESDGARITRPVAAYAPVMPSNESTFLGGRGLY
jgi:rare lipoprotein A